MDSQPPVKKSKISTTSIATRKPAGTTVTKKPVVTAAKKPMVTATKKPAVKSTANSKPAVKSAVARRPVAAKPAAKTSLTKKVTDKLSVKEGSGKQKRSAWDLKGRLQVCVVHVCGLCIVGDGWGYVPAKSELCSTSLFD